MRILLLPILTACTVPLLGQTFVRVRDDVTVRGPTTIGAGAATTSASAPAPTASCATLPLALQGVGIPGAGTLSPASFMNPATINRAGAIAFFANTTSSTRNQGIFVADAAGLHAIAIGCGQGGGSGAHGTCGDPSPIGGSFAGFFGGTVFAPAINDRGDVLFMADIVNGSAPRGLFLYVAATATIVKVAAVGDPSPLGGTLVAVGPGSLNAYGEVVFLAMSVSGYESDILHWQNGTTTLFATAGQPAPGGGTYLQLGTESFGMADGTTIPIGPVPAINDCGKVAFRAVAQTGGTTIGVVVRDQGVDQWYLRSGTATPAGGTFGSFQGAAINGRGEIAVFADYQTSGGAWTSGWFAGAPGSFRELLSFYGAVDGGQCMGLAYSRNPMTSIDDEGNVVMWCDTASAGNQGRLIVVDPNGGIEVLARQGGATGLGGTFGSLDAWPSISSAGRATIDAGVIQGGVSSPYLAAALCGPTLAVSPCSPPGGFVRIDNFGPATEAFAVFAALTATSMALPPFGTLEIGPTGVVPLYGPFVYPGTSGSHAAMLPLPASPGLVGVELFFQTLRISGSQLQLTNSASTTLR
ncbi:MAG: hypothetical protein JNN13_11720 [Planctomycetes bacterium]|nr:hypothetical protein [Planctomycetota bacterium]